MKSIYSFPYKMNSFICNLPKIFKILPFMKIIKRIDIVL